VDPSSQPPADAQPLRADLVPLLQEGIAAHWSMDRILGELGPSMHRYARPGRRFEALAQRLQRDEAVESLLEGLDGERTLWRVAQAARTPLALAACWVLHEAGGLALADSPASSGGALDVELVVSGAERAAPAAAPEAPRPRRNAGGKSHATLGLEIDERFALLGTLDHYALLGVARSADLATIKVAYHRAAKSYHPDALARAGLGAEARGRAGRIFSEIGKAYAALSDTERRRAYDASLANDGESLDADRLANAETNYRKGEVLLRQGNFRGAVDYLRAAVDLWPEEAAYQSALGWALFKKMPPEAAAAREHLERAVRLDARDDVALSRLAAVLRALGDDGSAPAE
jgi:DnaJ-domain-containing protein 1